MIRRKVGTKVKYEKKAHSVQKTTDRWKEFS